MAVHMVWLDTFSEYHFVRWLGCDGISIILFQVQPCILKIHSLHQDPLFLQSREVIQRVNRQIYSQLMLCWVRYTAATKPFTLAIYLAHLPHMSITGKTKYILVINIELNGYMQKLLHYFILYNYLHSIYYLYCSLPYITYNFDIYVLYLKTYNLITIMHSSLAPSSGENFYKV